MVLGVSFLVFTPCFALDWKSLHTQAAQNAVSSPTEMPADSSMESLYLRGLSLLQAHRDNEALEVFREIAHLDKGIYEAAWGEAECLRRLHRREKSKKMLEDVLRNHPDFAPAYISLAYIRYIEMDFEEAIRLAQQVIAMGMQQMDEFSYVRALLMVGGAKGMLAHYGGPFSKLLHGRSIFPFLRKAQSLRPDSPEVLFGVGSFYLALWSSEEILISRKDI